MPDQYQNFSNPTIVPEHPMGWQGANASLSQAIASGAQYLQKQQAAVQELQLKQAEDLSKAHIVASQYYPQAVPALQKMMAENPYAKKAFGNQTPVDPSQQGQMGGNPNVFAGMMGAPGANYQGQGVLPVNADGTANAGAGVSQNPVFTSAKMGGGKPPEYSVANPAGEAIVSGAKEYASKMSGEQAGAQAGTSKDIQQLGMITNALKPLVESYEKVYNSKVGGVLPAAGDVYGSSVVKNADWLPRGIQSNVVNPDTQKAAGQFLANKNEIVTKLQPLLSQQFGKDGSSRIMESLLHMSQNEIGDLNTPRAQLHGQITGTVGSLYRFVKAAQAYKQDLQTSGQQPPDPNTAASEIMRRMQAQTLQPAEQKELQGLIDDTLGNKPQAGSMNPVMNSQPTQQGQQAIPDGRITVISPNGQIGHIPQEQLQQALKEGYRQQ